jgi:hypothetical protein
MIFTVISKSAPMYGQGPKLGEDWYERAPGVPMFFYDEASVARELGGYGITDVSEIESRWRGVVPVLQRHLREALSARAARHAAGVHAASASTGAGSPASWGAERQQ